MGNHEKCLCFFKIMICSFTIDLMPTTCFKIYVTHYNQRLSKVWHVKQLNVFFPRAVLVPFTPLVGTLTVTKQSVGQIMSLQTGVYPNYMVLTVEYTRSTNFHVWLWALIVSRRPTAKFRVHKLICGQGCHPETCTIYLLRSLISPVYCL